MFHTTLKGILAHKLRLFAISIAVVLGVGLMAGSMVLTSTITRVFDDLFANAYADVDVAVRAPLPVEAVEGQSVPRPTIDAALMDAVAKVDGVEAVSGSIIQYAQVIDKNGKAIGNPGQGAPTYGSTWWDDPRFNPFTLSEGSGPANDAQVVLDRATAKKGHFQIGDPVRVQTNRGVRDFTVSGIAKFGSVDSPGGASFVLMTQAVAQQTMAGEGRLDSIDAIAVPGVSQETLRSRIAAAMPADVETMTGAAMIKENQDQMKEAMKFFSWFLSAFGIIALFVGAFIINNTFSILIAQRQRENALLRALGATRRQVMASVLVEALAVGVISAVLGFGFGVVVAYGLKALLAAFGMGLPATSLVIPANVIVVALVVGIGVSVASAVLPARRGSRVPPVAAMRDVAIESTGRPLVRSISGLLVLGAGTALMAVGLYGSVANPIKYVGPGAALVFLGTAVLGPVIARPAARVLGAPLARLRGITGDLARENTLRNPKRTARTASALIIGVALVTFISVLGASMKTSINDMIDSSYTGDLAIMGPQSFEGGLRTTLVDEVRALPEVEVATPMRVTSANVDGKGVSVGAIDPTTLERIYDANVVSGSLSQLDSTSIAISKKVADAKDVGIGGTLPVQFALNGVQPLRVVAIYDQATFGGYIISLDAYDRNVMTSFDTMVMMEIKPGVSPEAARAALEPLVATVPSAKLQDSTELKEQYAAQVDQLLNLVYALLALAVIIALLGIANTLMLSILERTRELGLLRAVGMTRAQVRSMIRWESVVVALLGTAQGVVIGILFGWAMQQALVEDGLEIFAVPVSRLGLIIAVAVLAGVVAALWPGRKASRLDVLRAVSTT